MRNILNFIIRYSAWFLFIIYAVAATTLLVLGSRYRQSVYLSSANVISGGLYNSSAEVLGYFHLKGINQSLQMSNSALQNEVLNLKNQIAQYKVLLSDTSYNNGSAKRYDYVTAAVINNNTRHPKNYFTIDKGETSGIKVGMGVVDQSGVVGIINVVGPHISRAISLLNENQKFSIKIKDTNFVGTLNWKTGDPKVAYVEEIPRHAIFHSGDTVVTSGYSTSFPEGIPVGKILNIIKGSDDSFYTLKVRLMSDFNSLSTVRIIKDIYKSEIDSLSRFDDLNISKI